MTTLNFNSPIKVITSGAAPTVSNLAKGEWAYGVIGGANRLFGNTGSTVIDFSGAVYTAGAGLTLSGNQFYVSGVIESMLTSTLQTKINNVLFKDNTTAYTPTANYHPATKLYVDTQMQAAMDVANGKTKSYVFDTLSDLNTWLTTNSGTLKVGDVMFIRALNTPDYWWDGTQKLELDAKTDLTNYYTSSQTDTAITNAITNATNAATSIKLGTVKLGSDTVQSASAAALGSTAARTYLTQLNAAGQLVVNVPWTDTNTTTVTVSNSGTGNGVASISASGSVITQNLTTFLTSVPLATTTTIGGIMLNQAPAAATIQAASTTAGRYYPVNITSTGIAYVNVPWTDSAATGTVLTAAASQPISVGGTASAVTTTINASAVVANNGLKVVGGAIDLDPTNITITLTVVEI